ncbi:dipeptidase [Halobacterium jilantaiense]|uniref:Membrane dipeptidase n=1 Tax=Halobacterium jilantaiense TaxID=355548 RepID=A0A1I0PS77_9EURY|nr:dipeptidase [Halobacterium jilantaiense]SEW17126.1 membrane dipeptidase [Halobacterium jilantaiense]
MTELPAVLDGHNDSLLALRRASADPSVFRDGHAGGDLDLPRAREGGLAAGLFAIFVPSEDRFGPERARSDTADGYRIERPPPLSPAAARRVTDDLIGVFDAITGFDGVRKCTTVDDLRACVDGDELGAVLHFEGSEAIAPDLSNFEAYYDRGLRSLGPAWSRPTQFADGVPFRYPSGPDCADGLTDAGRRLVERCDDRGVLVDCAHLASEGFWDVHEVSTNPLVVSHAAAHGVCPLSRNLTDDQLDAVADTGGVVGLTFAANALRPDGENDPEVPLSVVVEHVDYLVDRMGVDHVALGSDFDGATVVDSIGDAAGLPTLFTALRDAGYSQRDLRKLAHENWLRVLDAVWAS